MKLHSTIAVALLAAAPVFAQTAPTSGPTTQQLNAQNANNLCRIYFTTPKPGAAQQIEAGRQKHMQFHRAQKDTWTWHTFAIETGDNAGTYVTSTCGHSWKDFDDWEKRMAKADTADSQINLAPHVQSGRNSFYVYRADLSLAPPNQPPAALSAVTVYVLRPGTVPEFTDAIRKVNEALSKQPDWPKNSGWLQLVNGGATPTFVLLNSRQSWAEFAPLAKAPLDVLTEAIGKEGADAIVKTIRDSTTHLFTEAAKYRPDLSYVPGK